MAHQEYVMKTYVQLADVVTRVKECFVTLAWTKTNKILQCTKGPLCRFRFYSFAYYTLLLSIED